VASGTASGLPGLRVARAPTADREVAAGSAQGRGGPTCRGKGDGPFIVDPRASSRPAGQWWRLGNAHVWATADRRPTSVGAARGVARSSRRHVARAAQGRRGLGQRAAQSPRWHGAARRRRGCNVFLCPCLNTRNSKKLDRSAQSSE
jgi:hypothetical protein